MCNCSIWQLKHLLCNACSTRHRFFGYVMAKGICSFSSVHQRFLSLGLVLLEPAADSAGGCFCTECRRRHELCHHFLIITARPLTLSQLGSGATGTSCGVCKRLFHHYMLSWFCRRACCMLCDWTVASYALICTSYKQTDTCLTAIFPDILGKAVSRW